MKRRFMNEVFLLSSLLFAGFHVCAQSVSLSAHMVSPHTDTIQDTEYPQANQVQSLQSMDEGKITFISNGIERWVMEGNNLMAKNTGQSLFLGAGAGQSDDGSSNQNVFIGDNCGSLNTTGAYNVGVGFDALSENVSGEFNTAVGIRALENSTTGNLNTAIGGNALRLTTTGIGNTACGYSSLSSNTTGNYNSAFGMNALKSNVSGSYNTSIGLFTLYENTSGIYNTALGYSALISNTTGDYNVAAGYEAMESNTDGTSNSALGFLALRYNTIGDYNTAVGRAALENNTVGSYRTGIGYSANSTGSNYLNATCVGYNADVTGGNKVRIGNASVIEIGGSVDWSVLSDATFKKDVRNEVVGLDFINSLQPVTYRYDLDAIDDWYAEHYGERDSSDYPEKDEIESIRFSGFLAQQVEEVAQETGYNFSGICAPRNADDFYSLRYGTFVVPLVKAVQELSAQNDQLRQLYMEQQEVMILLMKDIEKLKSGAFKMMK